MGYQFIHLETYSRKADAKGRSTDFIFAEASRKPEASVHVPNPLPPVVVYGVGIEAVQGMHDAATAAATINVMGGHVRKLARDKKTLHTVVASHPFTMDEIRADPAKQREAEEWEKRTISWLRSQYGDDLKSVIRHEDESHYHLHAYVVPVDEPGMSALKYHPGVSAKREIMAVGPAQGEDAKGLSKRADKAYKAAMREWQDSYHEAVAVPCGLTRLGPQRRRLSREEWQREQVQAKALQKTIQQAKMVKASGHSFISRTQNEADAIRTAARQEKEAAEQAKAAAMAAREEAEKAQEEAEEVLSRAERYSGITGRLKAMWDALGESKLATKIRQEFAAEIVRVQAFAKTIQERLRVEEKRRHEAERKAREAERDAERARDAALKMQIERDRAYALLPAVQLQEIAAFTPTLQPRLRPSSATKKK
ncbi:plasmid recombination protein [Rhizobium leguminosarum]